MRLQTFPSLSDIAPEQWAKLEDPNFPFTDYAFLRALENTHCVGEEPGWQPRYLSLWEGEELLGATYLYIKDNSYGEFIFDWDWAQAYKQAGIPYYPKLVSAVPFTPATGPKLLSIPGPQRRSIQRKLLEATLNLAQEGKLSSLHSLFIPENEIELYQGAGMLLRHSFQFHWHNQNYSSFEDYLKALKRKRRQQVRKECREVEALPLSIHQFWGRDIQEEHLAAMMGFYRNTFSRYFSFPYLNSDFFFEIRQTMPENLLLTLAKNNGDWVAGSLNFFKGKNLYGRYWGAAKDFPFLHFDLCYYQNIKFAIEQGLEKFEAGAQGSHKMLRGLSLTPTYSAHWIAHPAFRQAIAQFLQEEKRHMDQNAAWAQEHNPYLPSLSSNY